MVALRRSGNHPERIVDMQSFMPTHKIIQVTKDLQDLSDLDAWIRGQEKPHSTMCQGAEMTMDSTVVLHAFRQAVTLEGCKFVVVPSNEAKIIMGCDMAAAVDTQLEEDSSPLQSNHEGTVQGGVAQALDELHQKV